KRGNEVNATVIRNRKSKLFNIGRRLDDPEPIAEPSDYGAADKNTAFERVLKSVFGFPSNRGKQPIFRIDWFVTCVHQHEAAGTICIFCEPRFETRLPEECRLLIARRTGNRNVRKLWDGLDR